MFCPKCGYQNDEGQHFCGGCGTQMFSPQPISSARPSAPVSNAVPAVAADYSMTTTDPLIGRIIEDRYRIEARIGAGGMGTVYQATRLMIGDAVALKVLHAEQVADPQAAERFRREAQAAARLKHPNAVSIYDFGVSREGLVFLAMELVEGQSLRSIIKQQGPLTVPAAAEIMHQACAALDEAHRQNIVHRDVKPDNIIIAATASGLRVKVLDFGIAKLRDLAPSAHNLTQTGSVMGTPHYMSPEQCLGEELDGRSDIYSLGIVLYEMLAGVVPFNSPTATAVVVQHVQQAPPSLRALNISISPVVEAVVLRALAKKRDERPSTAADLARELSAAVSGVPMIPQSPSVSTAVPASSSASIPVITPQSSGAVSNSGQMRTEVLSMPGRTSGAVTPAGMQPYSSGAQATAQPRSKLTPMLLVAFVALVLIAGAATVLLLKRTAKVVKEPDSSPKAPPGMAYVVGGEMMMGSDGGDEYERPKHKVTVKPFFIDLTEVTCEEYEKFIRATGHRTPPGWSNGQMPAGAARRPVTGVDWDDATAFAAWAGKRLPGEQEWEFAARGTDERLYPWGNEWKPGYANADTTSVGHMADVGAHAAGASPCGALDMVGNAWEWTVSDLTAYPGGQLSPDKLAGELKVIRGGCWKSNLNQATTTFRRGWPARGGNEYENTGFRCAKDITGIIAAEIRPSLQQSATPVSSVNPVPKPAGADESWKEFYEAFSAVLNKRDRITLRTMLSSPFDSGGGGDYSPRDWIGLIDAEKLWPQLQKSMGSGTKPYKEYSREIRKPSRVTNDNYLIFVFDADGKWRWKAVMGD